MTPKPTYVFPLVAALISSAAWSPCQAAPAQKQKADAPLVINSLTKNEVPNQISELNNIGQVLSGRAMYDDAEPYFHKALALWDKTPGASPILKARTLNNLALLYMNQQKFSQAEPHYKSALSILDKQKLPKDDPLLGITLDNLGQLYRLTKRYDQAEPLYRRALVAEEQSVGRQSTDYAITEVNLALLLIAKGNRTAAQPLLKDALDIFRNTVGTDSPAYQQTAQYLAVAEGKKTP